MAFHFSELGPVCARLQGFADEDGLVPEAGDRWQDFRWEHEVQRRFADPHLGEAIWETFVAEANAQMITAFEQLLDLEWDGTRHSLRP